MNPVSLILSGEMSSRLSTMVKAATANVPVEKVYRITDEIPDLRNKRLLFAIELNKAGFNIPLFELFSKLWDKGEDSLLNSSAAFLVNSPNELHTKSVTQTITLIANQLGCRFIGHPLIEATENLNNLHTWQKALKIPPEDILIELCKRLGIRLSEDNPTLINKPRILALHASSHKTSNTLMLWHMAKKYLNGCDVKELHVENGTVVDCIGCSYKMCLHYAKQSSCFYGGKVVEEIFPEIESANAIVWICPNYNDALSANLIAVINRMTSLYRKTKFYDKSIFAVIVSGNSGSDSVAKQLIGTLNINKGFRLPPYFSIMATANDPGTIKKVDGIEELAKKFAENIMREIKA
jgi:multimeric flavodoxin WrbA